MKLNGEPFRFTVWFTVWFAVTVPAVAVKLPVVAPATTVTEAGIVSAALLFEIVTALPPVGAAAEIITVHVEVAPDTTVAGEHATEDTVGGTG